MSADGTSAVALLDRLEAESGMPLRAMLEISDRCNEVCAHCYQVQGQKGELTTGQWRSVLDQLAAQGVLLLTISGGEATLRPDFLDILAHARARNFVVRLYTNGLTMTAELAAALRELSVLDVEISLYATHAETHDFVTGVPGSFERTLAGVRHLRAAGVPVTLKTVVMNVNQAEIAGYAEFAASVDAQFRLDAGGLMPREGGDLFPQALDPDEAAQVDVLRAYELTNPHAQGRQPEDELLCGAAHSLHVEPNGELRPCTMLDVKLGHVLEAGAFAGFHSPAAEDMRALRWGDVHGCRECDLGCYCTRCFAAARAESGDALGPYPSACKGARRAFKARHPDTDLKIVAQVGRDADLGPYRATDAGVFETIDDRVTPRDHELALKLDWTRHSELGKPAPQLAVRPGELIQIRRPGRKAPRLERVPGGPHAAFGDDVETNSRARPSVAGESPDDCTVPAQPDNAR
jgi:radical SAM protein with 4Fe4S-binding SPASM domain